jgi:hypothetical protein
LARLNGPGPRQRAWRDPNTAHRDSIACIAPQRPGERIATAAAQQSDPSPKTFTRPDQSDEWLAISEYKIGKCRREAPGPVATRLSQLCSDSIYVVPAARRGVGEEQSFPY